MLMKTKRVDFHAVDPQHRGIDVRLINWARWVKPGRQNWVSPMFRLYRSHAWQWHPVNTNDMVDTIDAMKIEKAVCALPEKHRAAIRWAYVVRNGPAAIMRELGLNGADLSEHLRDGRQMLQNRLRID